MTIFSLGSIRDFAGQKPFSGYMSFSPGTGEKNTTLFTPDKDKTYQLTFATMYNFSGTATGEWQIKVVTGGNPSVIYELLSAGASVGITCICNAPFEYPTTLQVETDFSVGGSVWASWGGWQYKRGEYWFGD